MKHDEKVIQTMTIIYIVYIMYIVYYILVTLRLTKPIPCFHKYLINNLLYYVIVTFVNVPFCIFYKDNDDDKKASVIVSFNITSIIYV